MRLPYHKTIIVVCFLGFLICLALILSGCASSRLGKGLDVAVVAASTADYVTTRHAIDSGRGREGNPLLGQSAIRQAVIKAIGTTGVILLADGMEKRGHKVTAHVVRTALAVGWSVIAYRNAQVGR